MILPDVNVLVYAHRVDMPEHVLYKAWLQGVVDKLEPFAVSELILSAVVRIVTNPKIFPVSTPPETAFRFVETLLGRPNCVRLRPGARHWEIFERLCRSSRATGKLTADAYHAALAVEHGCEFVTTDSDFARFPELRWRHPLRSAG